MEIVIALLVFSVPLVALFTEHRQKIKKLGGTHDQLLHDVRALEAKNAELEGRVPTLETIVTMDERSPQVRVEDDAVAEEPAFKVAANRNRAQR
jgi:hypothetical protein